MHSNNEVGTLQPIKEIAAIAHEPRRPDAHRRGPVDWARCAVDVNDLGVDLLTVAGHKLYAPKGIGVLFVRRGVKLESLIHGATHEGPPASRDGERAVHRRARHGLRRRPTSLPAATAGCGSCATGSGSGCTTGLGERIVLNGHPERRLPNTLNVNFVGQSASICCAKVPEIAASTGSACHEGAAAAVHAVAGADARWACRCTWDAAHCA